MCFHVQKAFPIWNIIDGFSAKRQSRKKVLQVHTVDSGLVVIHKKLIYFIRDQYQPSMKTASFCTLFSRSIFIFFGLI